MTRILTCLVFLSTCISTAYSQETFPINGVHDERSRHYAFTNATIHTDYATTIEKATLLIKEGKVVGAGVGITVPKDAVVTDLGGKHIYPSFIDIYSDYGIEELKAPKDDNPRPQMETNKKGAFGWNQSIKPETRGHELFKVNKDKAKELRKLGFGIVSTHQQDGVSRGTATLVTLGDQRDNLTVVKDRSANHLSFKKGVSKQQYPGSLMGSIALIRQTYLDGQWYSKTDEEEHNISLQAWLDNLELPQIFEVRDRLSLLRADKVGDEFEVQYIIKGSGDEYQRISEIKATDAPMIIPVNYPKAYDVEDPYDALNVTLGDMKHWELAPTNAGALEKAEINFAFTTAGLEKKDDFLGNIRKAVKHGLSEETALKALTIVPALFLEISDVAGTLDKSKEANFIITDKSIFDKECKIYQNWIRGHKYELKAYPPTDLKGVYSLEVKSEAPVSLNVKGDAGSSKAEIPVNDSTKIKVKLVQDGKLVSLSYSTEKEGKGEKTSLSGVLKGKNWEGNGTLPSGKWVSWKAVYKGEYKEDDKKDKKKGDDDEKEEEEKDPELGNVVYPFMAYGYETRPANENVLLKNATVWTNESDGKIEGADVLIKGGKISAVGKNLSAGGAKEIDCTGKHITAGIIDEHSHIAISRGVNEWTQSSSAEVSISDVVNSEDVNIYRQLSGGVTAAQLLHGSANPIGGQSGMIKMRWGYSPEEMKIAEADGFIKFALGENVKQSNWGDHNTVRFPQSRMGVEQTFYNYFIRAKEYEARMKDYKPKSKKPGPRRDLELDALLEIINSERFVTCHSYVQSEINMLMHVADSMGFKMNTFTHILEGYKVADKMKAHGVNASTFSDWWAYKYEVIDAIPHNATLMHDMGINVAINSDDAEMGRRLNQEAAKAVKYGGASEEDAFKMVTLNPAKMLHLDEQMGSLKAGKDADVVVWSDHPLSIYAQAEKTFVDGVCLFDLQEDKKMRKEIIRERARLIQKMIKEKKNGGDTQAPNGKHHHHWHCDDIGDYTN